MFRSQLALPLDILLAMLQNVRNLQTCQPLLLLAFPVCKKVDKVLQESQDLQDIAYINYLRSCIRTH